MGEVSEISLVRTATFWYSIEGKSNPKTDRKEIVFDKRSESEE